MAHADRISEIAENCSEMLAFMKNAEDIAELTAELIAALAEIHGKTVDVALNNAPCHDTLNEIRTVSLQACQKAKEFSTKLRLRYCKG